MMLNTTIAAEWESFRSHCLNGKSDDAVEVAQNIFYAAFESAVLMITSMPHIHRGDEDKIMDNINALRAEGLAFFNELAVKREAKVASHQQGDPF